MMSLLHRSAKRFLLTHGISFSGFAEIPLPVFLHRHMLGEESAQKNINDTFTRQFSVFVEDRMPEIALKNQQQGRLLTDEHWDVQHMHIYVPEQRKCKGEGLEHGSLQITGSATILNSVTHADDCVPTHVDDSVPSCSLEMAEAKFSSKLKEENKHFDGSASELAIFDACKASCKDNIKEKDLYSSIWGHKLEPAQTTKFPNDGKEACIAADSTSEFLVRDIKSASQNPNAKLMKKEGLKVSVNIIETGLQREDAGLLTVQDASEDCVKGTTTIPKNAYSDFCCYLKGVGTSEKENPFVKEQARVSQPYKRAEFAISKTKKNKKKMKKNKKNTNRQFGPEDLKHLSLTPHPFCTATSGQGSCEEKLKMHGESPKDAFTGLSNHNLMQSKSISPVACQKCSEYVYSKDSMSMEALKLNDKEKGESMDAAFVDRRQENRGITNESVEEKQKLFMYENSSNSSLHQDQKPGEVTKHLDLAEQSEKGDEAVSKNLIWEVESVKCRDTEHRTGETRGLWEKGPLHQPRDVHRPLMLGKDEQTYLHVLSHNEVIDKGSASQTHLLGKWRSVESTLKPHTCKESEAGNYFLGNKGKMIDYNPIKDVACFDSPSIFWERVRTIAPIGTVQSAVERAKWDFAGVRKVHYPLKNHKELYIILDLNGVLIKRWDKNPSIPGVCKLNKKWIQLRPGCIEFLHKAFSSFRVGIWSTMTQRNVLNTCNFLERQAHQNLPFFMLWSKDSCYQHRGVQRPNKAHVVADFKPLSHVWGHFKPYLGFHNTVLVDDSPYKACMNNPYNCIFPDAFEGQTDDKYLNDVLWPYLEKMRMSYNIQAYIASNPLGQLPVVAGHELYHHVQRVMNVFDYRASPLRVA